MIRALRRLARHAGRAVLGPPPGEADVFTQLSRRDVRWSTFCAAADYVNYEMVEGDVVEFGVFAGASLALLARAHGFDPKGMQRRMVGFDSFEGLPGSGETHARWHPGDCASMNAWHPLLAPGDPVTPEVTLRLFEACELPPPVLHVGPFTRTLPTVFPGQCPRVALVHVDCDLYESTREALEAVAPSLQDGAMLLFDDWFHYKGHPQKGEARALGEFLAAHPEWDAVHYRSYGVFCNAFILHRR